jgi:beta-lactamase superfamily II metal-dependent hydrolase
MEIHLLDMGQTMYGDCILIENDEKRILIDGAHPGDANSIRSQLKRILRKDPPFEVDLLIVTHCHSDHIGCLHDLIGLNQLKAKVALVADEHLGFGRDGRGNAPADAPGLSDTAKVLMAAFQEEDFSSLPDNELVQFLDDALSLEAKYLAMLKKLHEDGTEVIRYGKDFTVGDDATKNKLEEFEARFADFGLKILGPTLSHLFTCADVISSAAGIPTDSLKQLTDNINPIGLADMYRSLSQSIMADAAGAADRPGLGAAKNNQSIVIKVNAGGWTALLAGDMQLAKAEVPGLAEPMSALLKTIGDNGPYDFIKLTHHTSYNGVNENVLKVFSPTALYAHTGGRKDAGHPDTGALTLLKKNADRLTFARTDRNGIITVRRNTGTVGMEVSSGILNDFSPNIRTDEPIIQAPLEVFTSPARIEKQAKPVTISQKEEFVEVYTKIPHTNTKVTITIQVEKGNEGNMATVVDGADEPPSIAIAGGRELPLLLFITCSTILERNIGSAETKTVINAIKKHTRIELLDIPENERQLLDIAASVTKKLSSADFKGVVILGGYDVIPAQQLDVLDRALRNELINLNKISGDADNFMVWSDDIYGDKDGDLLPELPVSRIPDARRSDVVFAALTANDFSPANCFGISNTARPFADIIYKNLPGNPGPINVSETYASAHIPADTARGAVYYMLHGSDRDGTKFWGETLGGDEYLALSVENIPRSAPGTIVFTGCCWGALSVFQTAATKRDLSQIVPKSPEKSIALSYLLAGTQAFIGCTGSHYSPLKAPYNYYGKPMHDHFWAEIAKGTKPAEALFKAKKGYLKDLPHGQNDAFSKAVELKILRQYTCLGIGW